MVRFHKVFALLQGILQNTAPLWVHAKGAQILHPARRVPWAGGSAPSPSASSATLHCPARPASPSPCWESSALLHVTHTYTCNCQSHLNPLLLSTFQIILSDFLPLLLLMAFSIFNGFFPFFPFAETSSFCRVKKKTTHISQAREHQIHFYI